MPDGTISSRLELDGEKEYKAALNDAYRELRVLRSELKAETAELGANASAQDKARTKIKSLQSQIKEQEKIVQTLTKAFKDSQTEYADHQEVQDKWEEKLNKARAALAEMKNQLETSQDALRDFSTAMEDVSAGSDEAVQTVVSFNDCLKSIGSIVSGVGSSLEGIFTSSVETMKEMVSEMWELMGQAYAAAGDWKDIQAMYGGNVESIQGIFRGAGVMGVDTGTITSGIEKLTQNTHAGNADTLAALKKLHIEESQYSSHWDYFLDVMDQLAVREDGSELAGKIFGDKKGFGINLLLDQWKEIKDAYQQDIQETGLDLTAPEIEQLDEIGKRIGEIQGLWNEMRTSVGAKLSELLNIDSISEDALTILRDIGSIFSADGDRKELVMKLDTDISTLLGSISEGLDDFGTFLQELGGDLENSQNPLVSFVGKLMTSLGDLVGWIGENSDTIIGWLDKLLPLMGANTASEALTGMGLGDWLQGTLSTVLDVVAISKLGKSFGSSAAAEMAAGAVSMGSSIGAALLQAVPVLGVLGATLALANTLDQNAAEKATEEFIAETGHAPTAEDKNVFYDNPDTAPIILDAATKDAIAEIFGDKYGNIENSERFVSQDIKDALAEMFELPAEEVLQALGISELAEEVRQITEEPEKQEGTMVPVFSDAMREAAEAWWDAYRTDPMGDWDAQFAALTEALGGEESETFQIFDTLTDLLTDYEGDEGFEWGEDLPGWFWDMKTFVQNLAKGNSDKYTGDAENTKMEAKVTVHSHLYIDSDQIMEVVNEKTVGGMDFHVMG